MKKTPAKRGGAVTPKERASATLAARAALLQSIDELKELLEKLEAGCEITGEVRSEIIEALDVFYLVRSIEYGPLRGVAMQTWTYANLALELLQEHGARSNKAAVAAAIPKGSTPALRDKVLRALSEAKSGRAPVNTKFNPSVIEEAVKRLR